MTSLHIKTLSVRRSDGSEHHVAALDPSRVEDIGFIKYTSPPGDNSDPAAVDEWIERATFIEDDLHWLLQLPHDRFWCQLIFDSSLHQCIDSFLREAPRPHDAATVLPASRELPPEVSQHLLSLRRLFFFVCLRGSTHHETPADLIAPDVFGDIIYENYVFDIARLMDICAVYGQNSNTAPLVGKMIGNIFEHQTKYTDDLNEIVPTILQVFNTISAKCGIDADGMSQQTPVKKLSDISKSFRAPVEAMPTSDFEDIILYISDVAHTLHSFLKVYPPGALAFYNCNFPTRLASTYEQLTSAFDSAFRNRIWQDLEKMESIKRQFRRAQVSLLRIFRFVVYQNCLRPIIDGSSDDDDDDAIRDGVEGYLDIMGSLLSEKRFLAHLHVLFPFSGDRKIVVGSTYLVDETRLSYIDNAIADATSRHGKNPPRKNEPEEPATFEPEDSELAPETGLHYDYEGPDEDLGACAAKITGLELDSLVSCVRDLLPELGIRFVKLCLEEYGYDTEKVVNALLEDNLRPSLQGINRTLADTGTTDVIHHRPSDDNPPSLLKERRNIYDGDEFDVFSQSTIDTGKVHKGKRDTDVLTIVNSKLAPDIRARYAAAYAYSEIDRAEMDENDLENVVEYDDEYDDTYDSNIVGAGDADSADEMLARRPFVMPRILAKSSADSRTTGRNKDYDEDDEETGGSPAPPRDAFLEDPAKLRQQREERYAAQRQQRSGGPRWHAGGGGTGAAAQQSSGTGAAAQQSSGTGTAAQQQSSSGASAGGGQGQGPPSRDVKGGPKGQGQSSDVLKNRAWKEKNKASRVHHNRKDLADRKRRI